MNDKRRFISLLVLVMAVGAAGAFALPVPSFGGVTLSGLASWLDRGACNIKGNISYNTGELIYHVPGGEFYDDTVIDPRRGERWFCSEQEARTAGWRRSLR